MKHAAVVKVNSADKTLMTGAKSEPAASFQPHFEAEPLLNQQRFTISL